MTMTGKQQYSEKLPRFIPNTVDEETAKWLDECMTSLEARQKTYQTFRDYYDGNHRIRLTARAKKYLQASGYPYAHNLCERVVDSLVDRLEVQSIAVKVQFPKDELPGEKTNLGQRLKEKLKPATAATPPKDDQALELDTEEAHEAREAAAGAIATEWLTQRLEEVGFDELGNIVHHEAATGGDSYPGVYFDDEDQSPSLTYALPDNCVPKYKDGKPLELECIVKARIATIAGLPITLVTIYYADRWENYARSNSAWGQWIDPQTKTHVEPWLHANGKPRGVALGHIRNKNRGRQYGTSELRTALPQQDAINKRMVDADLVSDNQGYQQRWATGIEGSSSTLRNFPGSVWKTANVSARFGYFPAGDVAGVKSLIEMGVQHLAATTATPLHELTTTGTPPSGEAKKTADTPLVKKIKDRILTASGQWKRLFKMMVLMAIDHKLINVPGIENARISIELQWVDPEPRNEKEHWEIQQAKQSSGVSKHTTLLEDGYNPEREEQLRAQETNVQSAALLSAVNAGDEFGDAPA